MLQQVIKSPKEVEFREIKRPEPDEKEVLIEMKRIGICGSDIHVYNGHHPYTSFPVVQGHEVSGKIIETGQKVTKYTKGDKVTVQPQVVCGKCVPCQQGRYNICENLRVMGFQTTGLGAEYVTVPQEKVVKLPDEMSYDYGALIEPLAVAVHALKRGKEVEDQNILVLGGGPIGNLVGQCARAMGARKVMVTEISAYRREIAKKCGLVALNPQNKDLSQEIEKKFGSGHPDMILECVGVEKTIDQAVNIARKGTDIIIVGVFGDRPQVNLGLVQDHELRLIGSLMYTEEDYQQAVELIADDHLELDPLITTHFNFQEFGAAYEYIETKQDGVMKVMIDL